MPDTNSTKIEFGSTKSQIFDTVKLVTAYTPFLIIALGITGNPATLYYIVSIKSLRRMSSMVFLAFISIVDTFSLFTWNLDHFYVYKFSIKYVDTNIYLCKIMEFLQYFSLQSSGFLLSLLTIDRYVTIASTPGSFYSKLPFRTRKSAIIWSSCILGIIFILNSHIFILNGYFDQINYFNKTIESISNDSVYFLVEKNILISINFECGKYFTGFKVFPQWDQANIFLYIFIPAFFMFTFNSLIIYKISGNKNSRITINDMQFKKNQLKKRNLSLSLLAISFSSLILTEFFFSYFYLFFNPELSKLIGSLLDFISFFNHSTLFYNLILFNVSFRKHVFLKSKKLFHTFICLVYRKIHFQKA